MDQKLMEEWSKQDGGILDLRAKSTVPLPLAVGLGLLAAPLFTATLQKTAIWG
jgi:hypothetical protein